MEFPGGCFTNIRAIDGFSIIHWRIYTEEFGVSGLTSDAPSQGHTVLKHLSRLKNVELRLRSLDCLVSFYPRRLGIWVFSATPDFEGLRSLYANGNGDGSNRIVVDSITLKLSASGHIAPVELVKGLLDSQRPNVNPTESQKPRNAPIATRRRFYGNNRYAAIYSSFISAVTGAVSLQFIRRHGAIPLGSRTLFVAVEKDSYEGCRIVNGKFAAVPSLTTIQVQLASVGRLSVSLQTVAHTGLTRLYEPGDPISDILDIQPGINLCLSPNGSISRLVKVSVDSQDSSSSIPSSGRSGTLGSATASSAARRKQWKSDVVEWLRSFGLSVDSIEEEAWVEVEAYQPFYARLAGKTGQRNGENSFALPLKRILWPARYCFRTATPNAYRGLQDLPQSQNSPLEFAERWYTMASSRHIEADSELPSDSRTQQPPQTKRQRMSSSRTDPVEESASFPRQTPYPEIQAASLMYPTPPDGAAALGYMNSLDAFVGDPGIYPLKTDSRNQQGPDGVSSSDAYHAPNLTEGFGPSVGLAVGSGLYDMNVDDNLFGDMTDKDFISKGLNNADFNYFDNPGFGEDRSQYAKYYLLETQAATFDEQNLRSVPIHDTEASADKVEVESSRPHPPETTANVQNDEVCPIGPPPSFRDKSSQTISPPLSPVGVKRILFTGSDQNISTNEGREQRHYHPVAFKQNLNEWDRKYGSDGKFSFTRAKAESGPSPSSSANDIPTVGFPWRHGKIKSLAGSSFKSSRANDNRSNNVGLQSRSASVSSDSTSDYTDEAISKPNWSPKRKLFPSDPDKSMVAPPGKVSTVSDQHSTVCRAGDSAFLGKFVSCPYDWPLAGYFSIPENQALPILPDEEDQVHIAQLLVDQVTQSSLNHRLDGGTRFSDLEKDSFPLRTFLEESIFIGKIERLNLKEYVSLHDGYTITEEGTASRQSPLREEIGKGSISKLSSPHLRIRRDKDYLEILPPAILFWETFDLRPAHGAKDILAYCIHPHIAAGAADLFLERLGSLYSSCGLGKHTRGGVSEVFERGLGSWNVNPSDIPEYPSMVQSLNTLCEHLGSALSDNQQTGANVVVYIINPFNQGAALADICTAFWKSLQKYVSKIDRRQSRRVNELVLQVIPSEFVTSAHSIVVPTQVEYLNLALEVYSRCFSQISGSNFLDSAPPILLAEPVPKSINFKLTSEKASPLLDGKVLHLACSRSLDNRWVTVAWSDNTGSFQRTMSYCLRFRNLNATHSVSEVRNELWRVTRDIMKKIRAQRLLLVNTEPVDGEEIEAWTNLVEQYNKTRSITLELVILDVNTIPDLYLELPTLSVPTNIFNVQVSSTPGATPHQSGAISTSDRSGNAATPGSTVNINGNPTPSDNPSEANSDYLLTDICDESWAVVLSFQLNDSPHLMEYMPALASGYLLRRKGPTDSDGISTMTVNLIYTQQPPSSYGTLLRETLEMYRNLSSLARARGTYHVQRNTLPWHIATAVRGQELLSYVL